MPDADDIADAVATSAAAGIQSVTVDGNSTVAMDPLKQIEVEKHVAAKAARANSSGTLGLTMRKLKPTYE